MKGPLSSIAILALLVFAPAGLAAHPHMWIRGQIEPEFGRRGLEAVRVVWNIDELTSAPLILDYDTDRNGAFSPREVVAIRAGAFEHLIEYEYYLMIEVGELLATPTQAEAFNARIENGRVIYEFTVPLKVTIRWEDVPDIGMFLFDRSYFIDFRPDDMGDLTAGYGGRRVEFRRERRRSMTLGYGMIELTGLVVSGIEER